jgi:DNA-binding GntR family transcriptional regulator
MSNDVQTIGARRATLADEVRSEVERRILAGEIESGEKLNELALANSMGVSRGTVREAVRSLADTGLVEFFANRGAFVRRLTVDEIFNLYDLRGAIFGMACAATARNARQDGEGRVLAALQDNMQAMRAAFERDDRKAYYELNIAFHDMLLAGAQNDKAKVVYDGLVKEMHLFRRRGLSLAMNIAQSVQEHAAIVAAVEKGDARAAREAALHHIESGRGRFMATLADTVGQDLPEPSVARDPEVLAVEAAGRQQGGGFPQG